jgi:hypothetical protein
MKGRLRQETTTQVIAAAIVGALMFMLGSTVSNAETVNFDDADRGPSNVLQVAGITISRCDFGWGLGQPETVLGSGLGSATLGPVDEVNGIMQYLPGDQYGTYEYEGLTFSANGPINSITIVPVFRAFTDSGVLLPDKHLFGIWFASVYNDWYLIDPSVGNPITLVNPNPTFGDPPRNVPVSLLVQWDFGQHIILDDYRREHLSEGLTIECGFTILSLDYIPEPGTSALLGMSLFGLWSARRNRGR